MAERFKRGHSLFEKEPFCIALNHKCKQYDALEDPSASYYFRNHSVKKHLRTIKKALQTDRNASRRQRMTDLLTRKIKQRFIDPVCLKVQVYDHDISIEDFKGLLLPSKLKQSRRFNNTKNEKTDRSQTECTPALPKIQSVIKSDWQNPQYQKQDDVKLQEDVKIKDSRSVGLFKYESKNMQQLHKVRRERFLNFLEEKKKKVSEVASAQPLQTVHQ